VATGKATVVDVGDPLRSVHDARAWLSQAGEAELAAGLAVLNRALHAFRLATADPYLSPIARLDALVARVGYGAGEQVADGLWTAARELHFRTRRRRRSTLLAPQARLAAVLSGREGALACEELALRARLDLEHGRPRECALQLSIALDAALSELARDATAAALEPRLVELRGLRDSVVTAAQAALAGPLVPSDMELVAFTLGRIEAALRARAAAGA
jgi:hypothetical protein